MVCTCREPAAYLNTTNRLACISDDGGMKKSQLYIASLVNSLAAILLLTGTQA